MEENKGNKPILKEIKISNEEKKAISNNILIIPEKCTRCRFHPSEIMCKECYPFIYFCSKCNENIHSNKSKQNHKIISINELNEELNEEQLEENKNNIDENIFNNYNNIFNNDKINLSKNIKNYINDIISNRKNKFNK